MRRAILSLAILFTSCDDGPDVELLPAAERLTEDDCETHGEWMLDAAEYHAALLECVQRGAMVWWPEGASYVPADGGEVCELPHLNCHATSGPGYDEVCYEIAADTIAAVSAAIHCQQESLGSCEDPEAIQERADATEAAVCG